MLALCAELAHHSYFEVSAKAIEGTFEIPPFLEAFSLRQKIENG